MSSENSEPGITGIDHLGIAVHSIEKALSYYESALGITCDRVEEVESQKVRTAFLRVGNVHLELLEPMDSESPIAHYLERHGEGIHHIAFATTSVESQLAKASGAGVQLIHEVPFVGAGEKLVAFLHPKSCHGVLTEFCQPLEPADS